MNAEKIFGENAYVNLDEVIETVYQCRRDEANDEWVKRWLQPLKSLPTIEVSEDCISKTTVISELSLYRTTMKVCLNPRTLAIADALLGIIDDCIKLVEDAPSVVPSRAEGEWISQGDCGVTKCNRCGWSIEECIDYNYCPDCGAKMKGADDD